MLLLASMLAAAAYQAPRHIAPSPADDPLRIRLTDPGDDTAGELARALRLNTLYRELAERNPGVGLAWFDSASRLGWGPAVSNVVLFVHVGQGRALLGDRESDYDTGDMVLLRRGQEARFDPPAGILAFTVEEPLPAELPWIVRPDEDPRILGATAGGLERRDLLAWRPEQGPYVYRGLNARRERILDSTTHYHPLEGGYDELFLIQHTEPGAHLWIGEQLKPFLDPEQVPPDPASGFLRQVYVESGDLIYVPRGVVHRAVGGILAQVIAIPGFLSGGEIEVDSAIRRIDERLGPEHPSLMPFHGGPPYVGVELEREGFSISIEGRAFARYRSSDDPCFFPVLNPAGVRMTRAFPFEEREGEPRDHPHHRSIWFAHGALNGLDFWHQRAGGVRETELGRSSCGLGRGFFETRNDWLAPDGKLVCRDRRRFEAFALPDAFGLDGDLTLIATEEGLQLGDTKEGSMAIRLAPGLEVDHSGAPGSLLDSEGRRDALVWGQRARWVLASGGTGGQSAAVAMLDHPGNFRHPTTWHARTYGLLAANPFGLCDFEGAAPGTGDLELPPGGELRLRYRLLFFAGVPSAERVDEIFEEYGRR